MAYMYLITPEGIIEKTRITKAFLDEKIKEYNDLNKEIKELKEAVGVLPKG